MSRYLMTVVPNFFFSVGYGCHLHAVNEFRAANFYIKLTKISPAIGKKLTNHRFMMQIKKSPPSVTLTCPYDEQSGVCRGIL